MLYIYIKTQNALVQRINFNLDSQELPQNILWIDLLHPSVAEIAKKKIKIPYYILQNYAKTRDLDIKDIRYYLDEIIYHKISTKEKAALKRFIKACKALNLT